MCGGDMTEPVLPTWADIIAIGGAVLSAAYSWGVVGQKVNGLEADLAEQKKAHDALTASATQMSQSVARLEAGMTNIEKLVTEVRNAVLYKGAGGH